MSVKDIRSTGQCHVRADTKQAVYENMEMFLDECPFTKAISRTVRRATKRDDVGFRWVGVMRWERIITVEQARKTA